MVALFDALNDQVLMADHDTFAIGGLNSNINLFAVSAPLSDFEIPAKHNFGLSQKLTSSHPSK